MLTPALKEHAIVHASIPVGAGRPAARRPHAGRRFWLTLLIVLGLTLWLRLVLPESLPVFGDEGITIHWAQEFARRNSQGYPLLMDGRFLFGIALAWLGVDGPAPLRLARLAAAVLSLPGCAAAIGLGRCLGGRRAAALAGVFYAVLPYAVFHERQALADPLMASAGSVLVWAMLAGARRPRLALGGLGAAAYAAACLLKPSALVYGLAPALVVLVLPGWRGPRRRWLVFASAVVVLAAGLVLGSLVLLRARLGVNDGRAASGQMGFVQCPPLVCQGSLDEQWRATGAVAPALPEVMALDFGWPLVALAVLAPLVATGSGRRAAACLGLLILGVLAFFLVAGREQLVARYLSPLAAPLASLAAAGLVCLIRRARPGPRQVVLAVPLLALAAWPLGNSAALVVRPERARLPAFDRHQYFTGPVAGAAFQSAALAIRAESPDALIITRHFMRYALAAFFDPRAAQVLNPWEVRWREVEARLEAGAPIYLVDEIDAAAAAPPAGTEQRYPYRQGQAFIRVKTITRADPQARAQLYAFIYPLPDEILGDYRALAARLAQVSSPALLATYPPHQLPLLAQLLPPTSPLVPIAIGGDQPWLVSRVIASLQAHSLAVSGVQMIFLDESRLDPERQVETWLNTHLYRVGEQWFGPLRWVEYAGGTSRATVATDASACFGGSLCLERVEVLDPHPAPGSLLRLRLTWQAARPTRQAYKVFAHLSVGNRLVAQHDGQPVGELRPTTTWRAGEVVLDQFALALPPDAQDGQYELRLGLYQPDTGERLSYTTPDGRLLDAWVGGQISIP